MHELRESLLLASEEEQQALIEILFRPKFNPLDYAQRLSPEQVQYLPWDQRLAAIEQRFCFLAADGMTVLRGQSQALSYRQVLWQVSDYLKLVLPPDLTTDELEAELFLGLLQRSWKQLPRGEQTQLLRAMEQELAGTGHHQSPRDDSSNRQTPLGLLQQDSLRLLLEGGSALALGSLVRPLILKQFAQQFAKHLARRQLAQLALQQGGSLAAKLQHYALAKLAGRGMALNAASYGIARTVLGVVGPAMWAWFAADLGWRAIATNYPRIIPALYLLAQIRLSRAEEPVPA